MKTHFVWSALAVLLSPPWKTPTSSMALAQEDARCPPFQYYNPCFEDDATESLKATFVELDRWLEQLAKDLDAPSISFGVVYDQELVHYKSVGFTNFETQERPTPDSIYRIGSITKVWTVLLALKFRDEWIIRMDDPIAEYNSNFTIVNPWGINLKEISGKTLTFQQLASQVSGLPREVPCLIDCSTVTTNEILHRLSKQTLQHATDVQPSYSNLAFALLGNVLSEYAGYPSYNDSLFRNFLQPLGLDHTGLYLTPEQQKYAATGYIDKHTKADWLDIGWVGPAGQMFSSVNDLSRLLMQFFASYPSLYQQKLDPMTNRDDFVLAPQTLREMLRPIFLNPDQRTGFGAPWEIKIQNGHMIRTKGGNIQGFSSEIAMVPELKLGVVALVNRSGRSVMKSVSAFEILIPAFEKWTKEVEAAKFHASVKDNYDDLLGLYGVNGQVFVEISIDEASGFPRVSTPPEPSHGILTPVEYASGKEFIYHQRFSEDSACMNVTLNALDGLEFEFVHRENDAYQALRVDGLFYSFEFQRMESNENDHGWNRDVVHKVSTPSWLRGNFMAEQAPDTGMTLDWS